MITPLDQTPRGFESLVLVTPGNERHYTAQQDRTDCSARLAFRAINAMIFLMFAVVLAALTSATTTRAALGIDLAADYGYV